MVAVSRFAERTEKSSPQRTLKRAPVAVKQPGNSEGGLALRARSIKEEVNGRQVRGPSGTLNGRRVCVRHGAEDARLRVRTRWRRIRVGIAVEMRWPRTACRLLEAGAG